MKYFLLGILFALTLWEISISNYPRSVEVSNDSRKICMEYALKDHEKEVSKERWEWLKTQGDPNDVEFFYESCIGHITGKPATKRYMK